MNKQIAVYDTTLRDGSQGEGVNFSAAEKVRVTEELDRLGIHYIEGGWPGSNPKDMEYFEKAAKLKLKNARVAAFGSTRHAKNTPAKDPNIQKLVAAKTPVVTIFGKTWDLHVREALRVPLETNLEMIASSVKYLKRKVETVFYDAEHFFDGYNANPEYALQTLAAAAEAGAEALILCDTNGGMLPDRIRELTKQVVEMFPGVDVGIHTHNDGGMAVANSVEAVQAGAVQVQGTINGFGERVGNADLAQVLPTLELKMKRMSIGKKNLKRLTEVSRFVYEIANVPPRDNQPFVGRSAFAHKGGIHVSAMARNEMTYEHVRPETVGNERRILVSELSGRSNLVARAKYDLKAHPQRMKAVLKRIMELENRGYAFENADGSFDLLVAEIMEDGEEFFEVEAYRVMSEVEDALRRQSEATVKVRVGEKRFHEVAEGDHGPVDALGRALNKALLPVYPILERLRLIDYKVHIVDAQAATAAKVRVVIESGDGKDLWGTVGVSENIIEASFHALVDSFRYMLLRHRKVAHGKTKGARV